MEILKSKEWYNRIVDLRSICSVFQDFLRLTTFPKFRDLWEVEGRLLHRSETNPDWLLLWLKI